MKTYTSRLFTTALMTLSCVSFSAFAPFASADDWLQFRGSETNGIATGPALPGSLDNLSWTVDLEGRGCSSPVIVGDRVFVTSSAGHRQNRLLVTCLDAASGETVWERAFWATGRTICHEKMSVATPTPASDGKRIFAFYSSNDVACLDLDGNLLWYRGLTFDFPNVSNSLGMSSSLVVAGDTLVCMAENDTQSRTFGLNVEDGLTRWQLDRPRNANWTSPILWPGDEAQVLLQSSKGVTAISAKTGETAWEYEDGAATIPSLTASEGVAYVPSHGITAIRPGRSNPEVPEIVWQAAQLRPGTASPIVKEGRAYVINNAGVLSCASVEEGKRLWQCRLEGKFSASPIISGNHLYCVNEAGVAQVVQLGEDSGEVVSTRDLGETVLATPSGANGAVYFRSDKHLWKID